MEFSPYYIFSQNRPKTTEQLDLLLTARLFVMQKEPKKNGFI